MNRYRHPRLLALDDRAYLEEMSVRAELSRMGRFRERGERSASSRIALAFEKIVRASLARASEVSDNRILAYEEFHSLFGYTRRYRELDAIFIETAVTVLEIKATRSEKSAMKGTRQLRKTGQILASGTLGQTHEIVLVLLWIDTGGRPTAKVTWQPVATPDELASTVFGIAHNDRPYFYIRVTAEEAWSWRQEIDITIEDELWDEYEKEKLADARQLLFLKNSIWPRD